MAQSNRPLTKGDFISVNSIHDHQHNVLYGIVCYLLIYTINESPKTAPSPLGKYVELTLKIKLMSDVGIKLVPYIDIYFTIQLDVNLILMYVHEINTRKITFLCISIHNGFLHSYRRIKNMTFSAIYVTKPTSKCLQTILTDRVILTLLLLNVYGCNKLHYLLI